MGWELWSALGISVVMAYALVLKSRRMRRRAHEFEKLMLANGLEDERVGTLLARWRLVQVLGRGGMATVYRAVPADTLDPAQAVAIKVIHAEVAADPDHQRRFLREMQILTRVAHPNLVRMLECGDNFVVLELLEGTTLQARIREGRLDLQAVVAIAVSVMNGLEYAHGHGIIHRDLKPGNIMLTGSGEVKVLDFGVAKGGFARTVTASGDTMGTPAYLAPEQIQGEYSAATDQYSMGVMVYEMLAGRTPFASDDPMNTLMRQLTELPPRCATPVPAFPTPCTAWSCVCWRKRPSSGFPPCGRRSRP